MNDGLREAIERGYRERRSKSLVDDIAGSVRAFLALPPSEEEIDAALEAFVSSKLPMSPKTTWGSRINDALVASRAVLVRPPEETPE